MNENIIAPNVPNAITIIVMAAIGAVLLGYLRKLSGKNIPMIGYRPGTDAPGR